MKITCDREKLLSAFQSVTPVVPTRSPKPILQNVKLDVRDGNAVMTGTDLEISIRAEVTGVEIEQPGAAVLDKERFGKILSESSDELIKLETDKQGTIVRGDRSEFRLPGNIPEEFPDIGALDQAKFHKLSSRALRDAVRRTVFATDPESNRYALGGVLLEFQADKLIAVGTDGRRMAVAEAAAEATQEHGAGLGDTIIPTRAMRIIERSLADNDDPCQLSGQDSDALVKTGTTTIHARLLEGRFPRWRDVFPKSEGVHRIELVVGPLSAAVRQAAIVTNEDSRGVDFKFAEGQLTLTAESAELGQSHVELPISYPGEPLTIKMDPRYLIEFFRVLDPDRTVTLELRDSESAAVLSLDQAYRYVIMPLSG